MAKRTVLFLAANPCDTDPRALDREAHAIRAELSGSFRWEFVVEEMANAQIGIGFMLLWDVGLLAPRTQRLTLARFEQRLADPPYRRSPCRRRPRAIRSGWCKSFRSGSNAVF